MTTTLTDTAFNPLAESIVFSDAATSDGKAQGWTEQDELLRDLWARNLSPDLIANELGRSTAAVMTRAARLGLPRRFSPGRKRVARSPEEIQARQQQSRANSRSLSRAMFKEALAPKEGLGMRVCLMCVSPFQSAGRHNRICPKCKGSPEYEAGTRLPDIDF